jgi:hypothetical protein
LEEVGRFKENIMFEVCKVKVCKRGQVGADRTMKGIVDWGFAEFAVEEMVATFV